MRPIVKVEALGKEYRLGEVQRPWARTDFREAVTNFFRSPISAFRSGPDETVWALRDIEFEVPQGQVLGIIGRNGAGKSTLLKILSQITEPTTGRVEIYGRVGSLLEIGTGFHPELTGRENIYLNGAIIGMSRSEIAGKFDEIVAFAELEKFLDTPVKRYSSGMHMRLGFAVAAHLEPEILIVDEVLAVGDAQFQKKCLGKMGDVARHGRTVLFVSHNMVAVQSLCDRVMWLDEGRTVDIGDPPEIIGSYLKTAYSTEFESVWQDREEAPGNDRIRIRRVALYPEGGAPGEAITIRTPFIFEVEYWNLDPGAHLDARVHLFNQQGTLVFASAPIGESAWHDRPFPEGLFRSVCHVPGDLLNEGIHRIELAILKDQKHPVFRLKDAVTFEIQHAVERRGAFYGRWPGAVHPHLVWETSRVDGD